MRKGRLRDQAQTVSEMPPTSDSKAMCVSLHHAYHSPKTTVPPSPPWGCKGLSILTEGVAEVLKLNHSFLFTCIFPLREQNKKLSE
jgi:hypothetical protein